MTLVIPNVFHHIETYGMVGIKGSKIEYILDSVMRYEIKESLGSRAMRIDEGDALTILDVLYSHIFEHGRFAHAGFSDDIDRLAAVGSAYAEHVALAARVRRREIGNATIIILPIRVHDPIIRPKTLRDILAT